MIAHVKRDSNCNGNKKDNSEKQLEGKSQQQQNIYVKHFG